MSFVLQFFFPTKNIKFFSSGRWTNLDDNWEIVQGAFKQYCYTYCGFFQLFLLMRELSGINRILSRLEHLHCKSIEVATRANF